MGSGDDAPYFMLTNAGYAADAFGVPVGAVK
jgi:hypothetical protein